jgi:hypothetical protein
MAAQHSLAFPTVGTTERPLPANETTVASVLQARKRHNYRVCAHSGHCEHDDTLFVPSTRGWLRTRDSRHTEDANQPMARPPRCPRCDDPLVDEYTHYNCPPGTTESSHRHWVCSHCDNEWIEDLAS